MEDIFVNNYFCTIHVIFNTPNQTMYKKYLCTTNASITNASIANTLYLALFLYALPNDPLLYTPDVITTKKVTTIRKSDNLSE